MSRLRCRVCFDDTQKDGNELITPCNCTDPIHEKCFKKWSRTRIIGGMNFTHCEVCTYMYNVYIIYHEFKYTPPAVPTRARALMNLTPPRVLRIRDDEVEGGGARWGFLLLLYILLMVLIGIDTVLDFESQRFHLQDAVVQRAGVIWVILFIIPIVVYSIHWIIGSPRVIQLYERVRGGGLEEFKGYIGGCIVCCLAIICPSIFLPVHIFFLDVLLKVIIAVDLMRNVVLMPLLNSAISSVCSILSYPFK